MWSLLCTCMCLVAQLCPTLCDPMDCSPPGSSLLGNFPGKNTGGNYHFLTQESEDLPNSGIKSVSLASPSLAGGFFTTKLPGKPSLTCVLH